MRNVSIFSSQLWFLLDFPDNLFLSRFSQLRTATTATSNQVSPDFCSPSLPLFHPPPSPVCYLSDFMALLGLIQYHRRQKSAGWSGSSPAGGAAAPFCRSRKRFLSEGGPRCFLSGTSTVTATVTGNKCAKTRGGADALCVFDMGQMNGGGQEQRG